MGGRRPCTRPSTLGKHLGQERARVAVNERSSAAGSWATPGIAPGSARLCVKPCLARP